MTIRGEGSKNTQKTSLHKSIMKSKKEKERLTFAPGSCRMCNQFYKLKVCLRLSSSKFVFVPFYPA